MYVLTQHRGDEDGCSHAGKYQQATLLTKEKIMAVAIAKEMGQLYFENTLITGAELKYIQPQTWHIPYQIDYLCYAKVFIAFVSFSLAVTLRTV